MNGAPVPRATQAPQAPGAGVVRPRRRRPAASVLREPQRPLKSVARPVTSFTQLNQRTVANAPIGVEQLRKEFIDQGAQSYPLVVTRKDLKELRHHVMRLHSKDHVNIQNEQHFTPPVRLHRRDPDAPPPGKGDDDDRGEDVEEAKERERVEEEKELRRKKREEVQAQIAPSGTTKPKAFSGKKTEQKYRPDDTPEAKKRQLLRYEETLPWHLEDDDNKQTWVGTYESELSEKHIMLTMDNSSGQPVVQLAPLERWYRFNMKTKAKSTEDANFLKAKKDSFFAEREKNKLKQEQIASEFRREKRLRTRVGGGDDDAYRIKPPADDDVPPVKREADADDIDFNVEEDFADDEEGLNGLFEGDDQDIKEATEKLKRDHLQAGAFDLKDEREIEVEEERRLKEEEERKILEKSVRRALVKREKQYDYMDDDDSDYDETDSETERQRAKEEEEKKKAQEQDDKAVEGDKSASGASNKGASTPSGVHRSTDVNKKKRPGSPNLSEASGNESARKKHKKMHDRNPDGTRKTSSLHEVSKRGAASGSDSEMTDAGKSKKHKLKVRLGGTPGASPAGSRAGSPAAQVNGSRAGSPAAPGGAQATPQSRLPSASEIYKALPPEGMQIQALINKFRERVDKSNTGLFIKLVRAVASYDKARSWLIPLPELPSEEQIAATMKPKPAVKAAGPS